MVEKPAQPHSSASAPNAMIAESNRPLTTMPIIAYAFTSLAATIKRGPAKLVTPLAKNKALATLAAMTARRVRFGSPGPSRSRTASAPAMIMMAKHNTEQISERWYAVALAATASDIAGLWTLPLRL